MQTNEQTYTASRATHTDSWLETEKQAAQVAAFKEQYQRKLTALYGSSVEMASDSECYTALVQMVKELLGVKWQKSKEVQRISGRREVYYFSIEFLLGRQLGATLLNLGLQDVCRAALSELGLDLLQLQRLEEDPGLGNGGLGRLAACYLDSMATAGLPGHGCGIRYRYGLFEQTIIDGWQHEYPDNWLMNGYYWDVRKPDEAVEVRFGGTVTLQVDGKMTCQQQDYEAVMAIPYDVPIVGYHNDTVNTLRLWSAEGKISRISCAADERDCRKAIEYSQDIEQISNMLYPDDSTLAGKELRLKQQYFFVSAGLQSIVRGYKKNNGHLRDFANQIAIHINDTHPALVIPELMRILIDVEQLDWEEAWAITSQAVSYTNHTLLPEALETWPLTLFQHVLPRIAMLVNEINERFCRMLWEKYPGEWDLISRMAIIADGQVRMAHLAAAGCYSVNGVAELHTAILQQTVMKPFYEFAPQKFNNKTNGVTQRRWLALCNPLLAALLTESIGEGWLTHPAKLQELAYHVTDASFQHQLQRARLQNKVVLAKYIKDKYSITTDITSIFDVQIKRIHAYKRQTLNVLGIMDLYNRLKADPQLDIMPRTFIFGGKAASSYAIAKQTIKLIHALADKVNADPALQNKMKVVFMENYNVSLAELIIPAADVSEQIPTAGYEASGTGNMKFMLNGAVTLGTLDGANIEIQRAVGSDNIITFGLTAEEVLRHYREGTYQPWDLYHQDTRLQTVLEQLLSGFFAAGQEFRAHYDSLLSEGDHFFVLKDFASYLAAQARIDQLFRDKGRWLSMCGTNIAHAGFFSSDRTFGEYARDIWRQVH